MGKYFLSNKSICSVPFQKIESKTKNISLGTWEITEDLGSLRRVFPNLDTKPIKRPKRALEYYASRLIIRTLHPEVVVCNNHKGRPFPFQSPGFISISHSYPWAFAGYSPSIPLGLDVEKISIKAFNVSKKFCHQNEFALEQKLKKIEPVLFYSLIWSIKESVFKLMNIPGLVFSKDIEVAEINIPTKTFRVSVTNLEKTRFFKGQFWITRDFVFTFIPDINHECI